MRGTLAGGPRLTTALEAERRLEREREDVEEKDSQIEPGPISQPRKRFRVHARPMGVRPGINLDKALTLSEEMEDAEIPAT